MTTVPGIQSASPAMLVPPGLPGSSCSGCGCRSPEQGQQLASGRHQPELDKLSPICEADTRRCWAAASGTTCQMTVTQQLPSLQTAHRQVWGCQACLSRLIRALARNTFSRTGTRADEGSTAATFRTIISITASSAQDTEVAGRVVSFRGRRIGARCLVQLLQWWLPLWANKICRDLASCAEQGPEC